MTTEKALVISEQIQREDFPGLEGIALKTAEAIKAMKRPWGPGTATQLNEALQDWDGQASEKTVRSRANSLGRYMAKLKTQLAPHGIQVHIKTDGKTSQYSISA